jgi:hypothetical protein
LSATLPCAQRADGEGIERVPLVTKPMMSRATLARYRSADGRESVELLSHRHAATISDDGSPPRRTPLETISSSPLLSLSIR